MNKQTLVGIRKPSPFDQYLDKLSIEDLILLEQMINNNPGYSVLIGTIFPAIIKSNERAALSQLPMDQSSNFGDTDFIRLGNVRGQAAVIDALMGLLTGIENAKDRRLATKVVQ